MQKTNRENRRSLSVNSKAGVIRLSHGIHGFRLGFIAWLPWLLIACCLLPTANWCSSQIIVPHINEVVVSTPRFNAAFIRKHKINTITSTVVDKADGEIIRDKGLAQVFSFNTNGNLTRHYFNEIKGLVKTETEMPAVYRRGRLVKKESTKIDYQYRYDTLGTEYYYTTNGFLSMKRERIGDFYHTTYYEYFGDGLVSRQVLCKETNQASQGEPFKLGMQTILTEEKFGYEQLTPTQVKKTFLNDEGKPYKQGILNFKDGQPVDESYQFVVGFVRSGVNYKYNSSGKLEEKFMRDNSSGDNTVRITFEYDDLGNIKAEKKFMNGTQTNEVVYIYDDKKELITSRIDREILKESIKIIKYEYTYY